jgi:predicted amino acid dehydrogenase
VHIIASFRKIFGMIFDALNSLIARKILMMNAEEAYVSYSSSIECIQMLYCAHFQIVQECRILYSIGGKIIRRGYLLD